MTNEEFERCKPGDTVFVQAVEADETVLFVTARIKYKKEGYGKFIGLDTLKDTPLNGWKHYQDGELHISDVFVTKAEALNATKLELQRRISDREFSIKQDQHLIECIERIQSTILTQPNNGSLASRRY